MSLEALKANMSGLPRRHKPTIAQKLMSFAGIVAGLPGAVNTFLASPDLAAGLAFGALAIAAVAIIVYIQEGQRRIPIQYASRVRGRRMYQGGATFLPLRVNQAGVIPIIFAISILLFPVQMASYFSASGGLIEDVANVIIEWLSEGSPIYAITFFLLVTNLTYAFFEVYATIEFMTRGAAAART